MAPLKDAAVIARFRQVLSQWNYTGYITWKPIAREWVECNLEGFSTRAVAEQMYRFFAAGGEIDRVAETRREWSEQRYHYDFRLSIEGRAVYIETILVENDPDDPTIHVVSIHDV